MPQFKEDVDMLERVQRATKMTKALETSPYEEGLKDLGTVCLSWKRGD